MSLYKVLIGIVFLYNFLSSAFSAVRIPKDAPKAPWKTIRYKNNPQEVKADPTSHAIMKACSYRLPLTFKRKLFTCRDDFPCPNGLYCKEIDDPLRPGEKMDIKVCCMYGNFPCPKPLRNKFGLGLFACEKETECKRKQQDFVCLKNQVGYRICCAKHTLVKEGVIISDPKTLVCHYNGEVYNHTTVLYNDQICKKGTCEFSEMKWKKYPACECKYKGVEYKNLEEFPDGKCYDCRCFRGKIECGENKCLPCSINGMEQDHGYVFKVRHSLQNCSRCECDNGTVICETVPCPCTDPNTFGNYTHNEKYTKDQDCINCVCKNGISKCKPDRSCDCPYGKRIISHGNKRLYSVDQCTECTCNNTVFICPDDPGCRQCTEGNVIYDKGSTYVTKNTCQVCVCHSKIFSECRDTKLCEPITGCHSYGQNRYNGELFSIIDGGNCRSCHCKNRFVSCTMPGVNCPCLEQDGTEYLHGEEFNISNGKCANCICNNGKIKCKGVACNCTSENGTEYEHGEEFEQVDDGCSSACKCDNGTISCVHSPCPCTDESGKTYEHGQEFDFINGDCKACQCEYGKINCIESFCPCSRNNETFVHGDEFEMEDGCIVCECQDGKFDCTHNPACSCTHGDKAFQHATKYIDPEDACIECTCRNTVIECAKNPAC